MIDYAGILTLFYKGNEWTLNGDDYEGLTWLSDTEKPSKKELDDLLPAYKAKLAEIQQNKVNAEETLIEKLELSINEIREILG